MTPKEAAPSQQAEDAANGFVYGLYVWRGRSPAYMQSQKNKLAAIIDASHAGLREELERAKQARKHTQDWYAAHYGKLHDWARKRLPEPWVNEFFSCIANGTWGHDDVGEPYISQVGRIVPSGYFKMETAAEQLLRDQTTRAETAESELERAKQEANKLSMIVGGKCGACGVDLNEVCDLKSTVARLEAENAAMKKRLEGK